MDFDEMIEQYIVDRSLRKNTIISLRRSLKGFGLDKEKNRMKVQEILQSNYSQGTKRVTLRGIKAFYRYLKEFLHIDIENPTDGVRIVDGKPRHRVPTDQEISTLLGYIDSRCSIMDGLFTRLLILSGARCSTISVLRPRDMDSQWRLHLFNTKMDRRYSIAIPITDDYTKQLWSECANDRSQDDLLFDRNCHRRLQHLMKKLFPPDSTGEGLTPHSLRHGMATRLANSGVPIKTASAILDTSISVMLNNYVTVNQNDIDKLFDTVRDEGEKAKKLKHW